MLRTPLRRSQWLSDTSRAAVVLKIESLQPTFSYKVRGAFNAVLALAEQSDGGTRALVTASAGNHGRALAHAAAAGGMPCTVYAPERAPRTKLDAIRHLGADLRTCRDYDEAERRAKEHAARGDAVFVSPYSDPRVIAGAGTVGLEILEDDPAIDAVIVPVGGGGLISGIGIAAREVSGGRTMVMGVEAEASTPFTQGLAAGRIVAVDVRPTLADGLAGNLDPDTITFALVQQLVRTVAVVDEGSIARAIRGLALEEKLVVEGAGATAAAALASERFQLSGKRVAVVISGGNIDPEVLKSIL